MQSFKLGEYCAIIVLAGEVNVLKSILGESCDRLYFYYVLFCDG
jgi:hypothetical protein